MAERRRKKTYFYLKYKAKNMSKFKKNGLNALTEKWVQISTMNKKNGIHDNHSKKDVITNCTLKSNFDEAANIIILHVWFSSSKKPG